MARALLPSGTVLGPVLLSAKGQHVLANLGPAQAHDLAPATAGEQQEPDDISLLPAVLPGLRVQDAVEAGEFLAGQESCERRVVVSSHASGRINFDMTAGGGEVHDLLQDVEGAVGAARL